MLPFHLLLVKLIIVLVATETVVMEFAIPPVFKDRINLLQIQWMSDNGFSVFKYVQTFIKR